MQGPAPSEGIHLTLRILQESQVNLPAFLTGAGGESEEVDDIEGAEKAPKERGRLKSTRVVS